MSESRESRIRQMLDKVAENSGADPKVANLARMAQSELDALAKERVQEQATLAEFAEAYEKLTAPANRIAVFLALEESGQALVAMGDTEYRVLLDPKQDFDQELLVPGARVLLNEAYAIVGVMPTHSGGVIAKIGDVLEDGRLRMGAGHEGEPVRILERSAQLAETAIRAGDEVRVEPSGRFAVEHFGAKETRDYFIEEIPEVPWTEVGGQADAIKLIRDTIEKPLLHPEIYAKFDKKPVKGILLYGPPGCGKTLIGKATAYNLAKEVSERTGKEVKECFLNISGPKILNMWLGETERMVREIFQVARTKAKEGNLVVIFVDEAESVLRTRSAGRFLNISNTVVPQFCAEMDGVLGLENVVVILTSNRPDYIDPAVLRPERIDRKVKVKRPDRAAAQQILWIYLHDRLPVSQTLLDEFNGEEECARQALVEGAVAHLWRESRETEFLRLHLKNGQTETLYFRDLVSGALLKSVVDRAKEHAIERAIASGDPGEGLTREDLAEAIDAEFRENEIFPKSDVMDDWLKLLDVEPERVAAVKPIGDSERGPMGKSTVI